MRTRLIHNLTRLLSSLLLSLVFIFCIISSTLKAEVSEQDEWLLKRFVDPDHYKLAKEKNQYPDGKPIPADIPITDIYGKDNFQSWKMGVLWVNAQAKNRFPEPEDFLKLHQIVYPKDSNAFNAYWTKQITEKVPQNFRNQALLLLRRGELSKLSELTKIPPPSGTWRDGDVFATKKRPGATHVEDKYFTNKDLASLKRNPYLRVVREKEVSPGLWQVQYQFPLDGELVEQKVHAAFNEVKRNLHKIAPPVGTGGEDIAYQKEVSIVLARFYQRLVSLHPAWDGNGRTSKLIRDWFFEHLKLPVPSSTPVDDLLLSTEELAEDFMKSRSRKIPRERSCDENLAHVGR